MKETKTECAWCGVHMRGNPEAERVTHSICSVCEAVENRKIDATLISDGSHKLCLNCGHAFERAENAQYCRPECEMGHLR